MNRRVLVIGAGRVGVGKARILIQSGALVTMIASEVRAPLPDGLVACHLRDYRVGDLRGHHLVVSATGDVVTNERIVAEARYAGVWLNVVDDPERSDFYFTAVHRDGDVVVSVSTQGASPALAQELRSRIRDALPPNLAVVARQLRDERELFHARGLSTERVDWRHRISELLGESR